MTKLHGLGEEQTTMTEFFMAMIPPTATAQEHKVAVRNGKPIFYDPPEVKAAKEKLIANLSKYSLNTPYREGVRLITKWLFPNDGKHKNGEYKISKPDTDNLQKMFKDCMTKLDFWTDDQLVASEICEKFWADIPGIYVRIEEL
jgi:Holliday junction resolvase RusA-like endonuclease